VQDNLENKQNSGNWLSANFRGAFFKVTEKACRACFQSVLGYASETWAMTVEDMAERIEG